MKTQQMIFARLSILLLPVIFTLALPMFANAQGKIAFASNRDGNHEIYVMNPDGTNQTRLTSNTAVDLYPSFSPGGARIVFYSDRDGGNSEIYVMNSNGTGQTRLTNNSAIEFDPSFSPDGSKIIFMSARDGNFELYLMNADGSNQSRLTNFAGADFYPSFSPDGSKIVFVRDDEIFVMNADGSNPTQLTFTPGIDHRPSFSPDGSKITFFSNRDANEGPEIYVMDADGTDQLRLTNQQGGDFQPVFSPDGSKIAFGTNRDGNDEIYVMNAAGGAPQRLTTNTTVDTLPSWTDGSLIAPDLSNVAASSSNEGGITTLSGSIFSPNPAHGLSLTVNWGDGSEQVYNYPAGTISFSETHQYLDNLFDIPYTINATLSTASGSDSEATIASVLNVAPTLFVNQPLPIVIGSPLTLSGNISDPGSLDAQTITIAWGDGSPNTTINFDAGESDFSANHTYAAVGAYSITVSATDDDGGNATPQNLLVGVVPPPTSGKIAFASNFSGNNNIWLMNSNGTNQVALTDHPANDAYPNLSRDGSKIVFQSGRDGNWEIYTMNAAGAFETRLTNDPGDDTEPVYSPDGSKIVFETNRHGTFEIYIMNSDGTGQQRLTNNSVDDGQAEFSPDGTKIIFARLNGAESHIYTMNLDGTGQTPLTSGLFEINGYPSYSPNGQKIVFSRANLSHTNGEIYVMDANGANPVRLTAVSGNDLEATFSPNGSKIAFRSERDGNAEIYIMDANGANQQRITFDGAGITNFAPSWSDVSIVNVDIPDDLARETGAILTVPINVTDTTGKGIISYDFALNYDPAVLEPLGSAFDKAGTLSAGFEINAGTSTPGRIVISGFGTLPLTGAGTLLNLRFNVIGTPPTSSDLILDPFVFNEGIPFAEVSAGQVFVQGTIRGAVTYGTSAATVAVPGVSLDAVGSPNTSTITDSNGSYVLGGFGPGAYTVTPSKTGDIPGTAITALDASFVSQFLVGTIVLTQNQQAAGEVSGNGTLTSFDAALIAQYVVGLPNTGQTGSWRFLPPSRNYATIGNLTGENYTAILLGEVSGNWLSSIAGSFTSPGTYEGSKTLRSDSLQIDAQSPRAEARVDLPSIKAKPKQSLRIPVSLSLPRSAGSIEAYQFDLLYDANVLQLEAVPIETGGTVSSGLSVVTNRLESGRLRIAVYGATPINSDGTLLYMYFRVIGVAGSSSDLTLVNLMINEGNPAASSRSGKVTVRR